MDIPHTLTELFERVARETARMSYPGSMSRGNAPLVLKGTKAALEDYFAVKFPLRDVWLSSPQVASHYEAWHQSQTEEIAKALETTISKRINATAVAAKFLNTFMHQLMKYEPCRALWPKLHLPLDARIFAALARLRSPSLLAVQALFAESPYLLPYMAHLDIQHALWRLVHELNVRPGVEFKIGSRIELNWLWI